MTRLKPKLFSVMKHYTRQQFLKDVQAGVIVAIIALPLSIALAIASGVSPEKGLHTAIIAGFIISFLGGSRVQIGGPTGAFMVIVYGIVSEFGVEGLMIATFMSGIFMVLMGVLKLGSMIKFIPYPIITGFTSGIALVIFSSQIKDFFGLQTGPMPAEFLDKWVVMFQNIGTFDVTTFLIGLIALLIILIWPRVNGKIPGAFIALIVTSFIVQLLDLDVATIGSQYTNLSSALPKLHIQSVTFSQIKSLIPPALTIAILGSIESLLSAVVSDGMIGSKHRSNMELVAQGVANMASGLFGGIPATGAIARTVANVKNGGRTPIAGMVHAITLLLIMVLFMPLAKMIPLSTLAAILIVVAYNMSEWREFKALFSSPKSDIIVLLVTFVITVLIDLVVAIEVGVVLAAFLFMKRMADVTHMNISSMDASEESDDWDYDHNKDDLNEKNVDGIQIYEINGPFFFGAADKFVETLGQLGTRTKVLIIRMGNVPAMDATAIHAFKNLFQICHKKNIHLMISEVQPQPFDVMTKAKLLSQLPNGDCYDSFDMALIIAKNIATNKK